MADRSRPSALTRVAADLLAALGLFTRLPLEWLERIAAPVDLRRSIWVWPLVGIAVGLVTAVVATLGLAWNLPPLVAAICAVMTQLLMTGGLHEDGLADSADGLGGGRTAERRLEIMRDSRIGSYGALALGTCVALRVACIATLPPAALICCLALSGGLARTSLLVVMRWTPPARRDGMAAALFPLPVRLTGMTLFAVALVTLLVLPSQEGAVVLMAALLATLLLRRTAMRSIGGFTGDILGAAAVLSELAALLVMVSFAR
ncbi:adenosylcobinamide-GDP ribazoletransferase [Acetobacter conturbans]|uniref:adenosylcobinamide-GDP ribazoletransferase n=1 Tax=Acetobacter conturbans TaxID=1737472 RepID=UPI0030D0A0E7